MRSSRLMRSSARSRKGNSVIQASSQQYQQTREKLKEKEKFSQDVKQLFNNKCREKYIRQLEERNRKLKYQIIKINEMLDEHKEKAAVKRQYKLIPTESSAEVLKKQLDNVYKLIKNYQYQINALQTKHAGGLITDKMAKMQTIFSEKSKHLTKLKSQLIKLTKQSMDNSKKLKDNFEKQRIENVLLKYNDEIKVLRDRVRNAEQLQNKKVENAKKQYEYIKKLERELMQNGVPMDEIDDLKKNNLYIQIYDKLKHSNSPKNNANNNKVLKSINNQLKVQPKEQIIEDMTIDRFMELKNQVKLYKKLHEDYQKKLDVLEKEKLKQEKLTEASNKKLQEKINERNEIQKQVKLLKVKIKGINIKSNYQAPTPEITSKKQKPKMPTTRLKKNSQAAKMASDQIQIKYDEKGKYSQKGQRFTDRSIIGKIPNTKISYVKVWVEKSSNIICGIQCGYKINNKIKFGEEHITQQSKKFCAQNVIELQDGDYIKAISGHLSANNIIEYLVFISNSSVIGRFGEAKPTQKQFNFDIQDDQLPICMYGSIVNTAIDGQQIKSVSLLQQLGFEIAKDKSYGTDLL